MAASSWGEFIARLPPEVRAMVDCLGEEEREAFSYLASYAAFDHHHYWSSSGGKVSKKHSGRSKHLHLQQQQQQQQNPTRGGNHERAFGCECLDCYLKYWHLWVSSPNTQVIDKALELLELSTSSTPSSSRNSWKKSKAHKPKKSFNTNSRKPKDSPELGCPQQESEDPECGGVVMEKKPSLSPPPPTPSGKPRSSKQVAPLDYSFKEGELVEVVEDLGAGGASGDGGGGGSGENEIRGAGKSQTFGNRASEALGFACEKLLWMWNPRFRRRQ